MEIDDNGRWNIVDNTTGILGHVSQINTLRISIYIFRTIKKSSREYRHVVGLDVSETTLSPQPLPTMR